MDLLILHRPAPQARAIRVRVRVIKVRGEDDLHEPARERCGLGGCDGRQVAIEGGAEREQDEGGWDEGDDVGANVRLTVDLREVEVVRDQRQAKCWRPQEWGQPDRRENEGQEGHAGERHRNDGELRRRDEAEHLASRLAIATVLGDLESRAAEPRVERDELWQRACHRKAQDQAEDSHDHVDRRRRVWQQRH
eukprot:scaffold52957_cov48-Phaeocystis_antarctica.AAC.3